MVMLPTALATVFTRPTEASSRYCVHLHLLISSFYKKTSRTREVTVKTPGHTARSPKTEPGFETGMSCSRASKTNEKMNGGGREGMDEE